MKLGWTVTAQLLALKTSAAFAAGDVIKIGVLNDHSGLFASHHVSRAGEEA